MVALKNCRLICRCEMTRIGTAHDMPTKFIATQHQNVWVNVPKNLEGLKCQKQAMPNV